MLSTLKTLTAIVASAGLMLTIGSGTADAKTDPASIITATATGAEGAITLTLSGVSNGVRLAAFENGGAKASPSSRSKCTYKKAAKTPQACTATITIPVSTGGNHTITVEIGKKQTSLVVQTPQAAPSEAWEEEMLAAVNAVRAKVGAAPLSLCANLNKAANDFATDLADQNYFSHTGKDGSTPASRGQAAGYGTYVGENIAAGQASVSEVMTSWINSPGHYANLINATYQHVGFGHHETPGGDYQGQRWVQDFGANGKC